MKNIERKTKFRLFGSVEEFVKEEGRHAPSLHEKYLDLIEKDRKMIKRASDLFGTKAGIQR